MENWSVRDDSPIPRRTQSSPVGWWLALAALVAASIGGAYYLWPRSPEPLGLREPAVAPRAAAPAAEAPPAAEPAVRHPLVVPEYAPPSLPALDQSDSLAREAVSGLIGNRPFQQFVRPTELIRRIVATVDNLPRQTAPHRLMPLQAVPGRFSVSGPEEALELSTANQARYVPYVRVFESLDSRALVRRYVDAYPLFQRAYEELGYPNRYFNDRLVQAIDDLLAAPELDGPVALARPKVLYEFADPDLERRSAGQKIMLRMGSDNAVRVKAKLREIRAELARASGARQ